VGEGEVEMSDEEERERERGKRRTGHFAGGTERVYTRIRSSLSEQEEQESESGPFALSLSPLSLLPLTCLPLLLTTVEMLPYSL
jgi:hypothetical protein